MSNGRHHHSLLLAFLALALLCAPACAASSHYLIEGSLPPSLLPLPPAEGDAVWKRDLATVEAAQKDISADDLAALKNEQHLRVEIMTHILGDDVTRTSVPETFALLDKVMADSESVVHADKDFFHTRRPYLTDPQVRLLIDPIDANPAYPSGHTCTVYVLAEVLAMIYPERAADLRAQAARVAQHRIQAGVHSPSDVAGGQRLAMLIVGALTQSVDFVTDLAAARRERAGRR